MNDSNSCQAICEGGSKRDWGGRREKLGVKGGRRVIVIMWPHGLGSVWRVAQKTH